MGERIDSDLNFLVNIDKILQNHIKNREFTLAAKTFTQSVKFRQNLYAQNSPKVLLYTQKELQKFYISISLLLKEKKHEKVLEALKILSDLLLSFPTHQFTKEKSEIFNALSCAFRQREDLIKAKKWAKESFRIVESLTSPNIQKSLILLNLTAVYTDMLNHKKAIQYCRLAVDTCESLLINPSSNKKSKLNLVSQLAVSYFNLGVNYENLKSFDSAIKWYEKACLLLKSQVSKDFHELLVKCEKGHQRVKQLKLKGEFEEVLNDGLKCAEEVVIIEEENRSPIQRRAVTPVMKSLPALKSMKNEPKFPVEKNFCYQTSSKLIIRNNGRRGNKTPVLRSSRNSGRSIRRVEIPSILEKTSNSTSVRTSIKTLVSEIEAGSKSPAEESIFLKESLQDEFHEDGTPIEEVKVKRESNIKLVCEKTSSYEVQFKPVVELYQNILEEKKIIGIEFDKAIFNKSATLIQKNFKMKVELEKFRLIKRQKWVIKKKVITRINNELAEIVVSQNQELKRLHVKINNNEYTLDWGDNNTIEELQYDTVQGVFISEFLPTQELSDNTIEDDYSFLIRDSRKNTIDSFDERLFFESRKRISNPKKEILYTEQRSEHLFNGNLLAKADRMMGNILCSLEILIEGFEEVFFEVFAYSEFLIENLKSVFEVNEIMEVLHATNSDHILQRRHEIFRYLAIENNKLVLKRSPEYEHLFNTLAQMANQIHYEFSFYFEEKKEEKWLIIDAKASNSSSLEKCLFLSFSEVLDLVKTPVNIAEENIKAILSKIGIENNRLCLIENRISEKRKNIINEPFVNPYQNIEQEDPIVVSSNSIEKIEEKFREFEAKKLIELLSLVTSEYDLKERRQIEFNSKSYLCSIFYSPSKGKTKILAYLPNQEDPLEYSKPRPYYEGIMDIVFIDDDEIMLDMSSSDDSSDDSSSSSLENEDKPVLKAKKNINGILFKILIFKEPYSYYIEVENDETNISNRFTIKELEKKYKFEVTPEVLYRDLNIENGDLALFNEENFEELKSSRNVIEGKIVIRTSKRVARKLYTITMEVFEYEESNNELTGSDLLIFTVFCNSSKQRKVEISIQEASEKTGISMEYIRPIGHELINRFLVISSYYLGFDFKKEPLDLNELVTKIQAMFKGYMTRKNRTSYKTRTSTVLVTLKKRLMAGLEFTVYAYEIHPRIRIEAVSSTDKLILIIEEKDIFPFNEELTRKQILDNLLIPNLCISEKNGKKNLCIDPKFRITTEKIERFKTMKKQALKSQNSFSSLKKSSPISHSSAYPEDYSIQTAAREIQSLARNSLRPSIPRESPSPTLTKEKSVLSSKSDLILKTGHSISGESCIVSFFELEEGILIEVSTEFDIYSLLVPQKLEFLPTEWKEAFCQEKLTRLAFVENKLILKDPNENAPKLIYKTVEKISDRKMTISVLSSLKGTFFEVEDTHTHKIYKLQISSEKLSPTESFLSEIKSLLPKLRIIKLLSRESLTIIN